MPSNERTPGDSPEIRPGMTKVQEVHFSTLQPGNKIIVELEGRQPSSVYDITVTEVMPDGLRAHWIEWWSLGDEAPEVESDDVLEVLEEIVDGEASSASEYEGTVVGVFSHNIKPGGKAKMEKGLLRTSSATISSRLLLANAFDLKRLEDLTDEIGEYVSSPIAAIYLAQSD